jgi:hypothetical protein
MGRTGYSNTAHPAGQFPDLPRQWLRPDKMCVRSLTLIHLLTDVGEEVNNHRTKPTSVRGMEGSLGLLYMPSELRVELTSRECFKFFQFAHFSLFSLIEK